jgi:hypothetical protein
VVSFCCIFQKTKLCGFGPEATYTKTFYAILFPPVGGILPDHHIPSDFIIGEECRLWRSSLCVFSSILFSNTLSLCSSFNVRDHVSHPYNMTVFYLTGWIWFIYFFYLTLWCYVVVSIPLYSGGTGLEFWSRDHLFWMRFLWFPLKLGEYLKRGHNHFHLHFFQFIIQNHHTVQCSIIINTANKHY